MFVSKAVLNARSPAFNTVQMAWVTGLGFALLFREPGICTGFERMLLAADTALAAPRTDACRCRTLRASRPSPVSGGSSGCGGAAMTVAVPRGPSTIPTFSVLPSTLPRTWTRCWLRASSGGRSTKLYSPSQTSHAYGIRRDNKCLPERKTFCQHRTMHCTTFQF